MTDLDRYHHDLLFAADRVAVAVRTEDPDTIAATIDAALALPVPAGGPDPVRALVTALAVQIDPEAVPMRRRIAWTFDIDAINDIPAPAPSSCGYYGSAGYGGLAREQHRPVAQAHPRGPATARRPAAPARRTPAQQPAPDRPRSHGRRDPG